jgi:hypothetical protein
MADPKVWNLEADQWTKIAGNVTGGTVHVMSTGSGVKLFQTYRTSGNDAPINLDDAVLLEQPKEDISSSSGIDVYVYPKDGTAKLRVDL